jgi:glutathione S-transferase
MKLITSPTTPYGRKVRIVLLEKKIPCELVFDVPWEAGTRVPDYNPLGKVPVLEIKEGESLYDSRVIVEYLEQVSPVNRLIPQEGSTPIFVRKIEALAEGVTDAAAAIYLERKRDPVRQDADWIARQQGKVARGLQALAEQLGDRLFFTGTRLSLAEIATGCTLGYLDLRFAGEIDWRSQHPALAALAERLATRASFQQTLPLV